MIQWATSPAYGSVVLGPVQASTLAHVHALTRGGRRPYVTLGRLASMVGRPTSSVHEALGRLRALGLIGCAARMGRRGGHRLWRPTDRRKSVGAVGDASVRTLDVGRHRRAVARILAMRTHEVHRPEDREAGTRPIWDEPANPTPPSDPAPPRSGDDGGVRGSLDDIIRRLGHTLPWWEDDKSASPDTKEDPR